MKENIRKKIDEQQNKPQKSDLTIGVSADELVKNLEDDFAVDTYIAQSCEMMEHTIDQLRNLYNEEKQTLFYYKMSVEKNIASASDIFDHTNDLLKQLDATEEEIYALQKKLEQKTNLFSQEEKEAYTIKIQKISDTFMHAILEVRNICYEQKQLIDDIK